MSAAQYAGLAGGVVVGGLVGGPLGAVIGGVVGFAVGGIGNEQAPELTASFWSDGRADTEPLLTSDEVAAGKTPPSYSDVHGRVWTYGPEVGTMRSGSKAISIMGMTTRAQIGLAADAA